MKKITSILLVFAIALSCFVFIGCDLWNQIVNPTFNSTYDDVVWEDKRYCDATVEDDFVPGRVLVLLDKAISKPNKVYEKEFFSGVAIEEIIDLTQRENPVDTKEEFRQILLLVLIDNSKEAVIDAIKVLEQIEGIVAAEPDYYVYPDEIPDDPYYSYVNNERDQWALDAIDAPLAWDFVTGTNEVRIGVVDTGIASHPDLNGNYDISDALDFYDVSTVVPSIGKADTNSHGTHVAGIIGAVGNNGVGVSGVNWDVSLVQLRSLYATDSTTAIINAVNYANDLWYTGQRIHILSFSIGMGGHSSGLESEIRSYCEKGGLFVCSTGNKPQDNDLEGQHHYPSFYASELYSNPIDNMITVGRSDINDERPNGANWGDETIMLYAPGQNIVSTIPLALCNDNCTSSNHIGYGYHLKSGSSMATPFVTGVAALLLSVNPDLTAAQLKECILNGADIISITTGDGTTQNVKKLNAWGAFKYLMNNYPSFARTVGFNDVTYTYDIDADAEYMKDHTAMMKLDLADAGQYTFTVSADDAIDVKFYDSSITEITTTQTKTNNNGTVEFTLTLSEGTYYLRTNYVDSTSEGTVNVEVDCPHVHSYDYWKYESDFLHISQCGCGTTGTETAPHAYLMGSINQTYLTCVDCGYVKYPGLGGFIPGPFAEYKVSVNGSYQTSDGTIYLVPEDLDAYLNGTLVFYDKDDLPVVK